MDRWRIFCGPRSFCSQRNLFHSERLSIILNQHSVLTSSVYSSSSSCCSLATCGCVLSRWFFRGSSAKSSLKRNPPRPSPARYQLIPRLGRSRCTALTSGLRWPCTANAPPILQIQKIINFLPVRHKQFFLTCGVANCWRFLGSKVINQHVSISVGLFRLMKEPVLVFSQHLAPS